MRDKLALAVKHPLSDEDCVTPALRPGPPDGDEPSPSSSSADTTGTLPSQGSTPHTRVFVHRPSPLRHCYTAPDEASAGDASDLSLPQSTVPAEGTVRSFTRRLDQLCSLEHGSDDEPSICESCMEESSKWQKCLIREWQYAGMMLIGLFAIEITVFGFQSAGLISTMNTTARNCVSLAGLITSVELVHLSWLSFRFSGVDSQIFAERAKDFFGTYVFFSFKSRLPAVATVITLVTMVIFTVAVIEEEWKSTAIGIFILLLALIALEHIIAIGGVAAMVIWWLISNYHPGGEDLPPSTRHGSNVSWLFIVRTYLFLGGAFWWPMLRSYEGPWYPFDLLSIEAAFTLAFLPLVSIFGHYIGPFLTVCQRRFSWRPIPNCPGLMYLTQGLSDLFIAIWIILGLIGWSRNSDPDTPYVVSQSVLLGLHIGLIALEAGLGRWKARRLAMLREREERMALIGGVGPV